MRSLDALMSYPRERFQISFSCTVRNILASSESVLRIALRVALRVALMVALMVAVMVALSAKALEPEDSAVSQAAPSNISRACSTETLGSQVGSGSGCLSSTCCLACSRAAAAASYSFLA